MKSFPVWLPGPIFLRGGGVCLLRRYGTSLLVLTSSGSHQSRRCASYWNAFLLEHKNRKKQECIPVGCVPPTHYHTGGLCLGALPFSPEDPPGQRPPGQRPNWTETPQTETALDRDRPGQRPPRQRHPGQITETPWTETPWTESVKNVWNLFQFLYLFPLVDGYRRFSVTILC